MASKEKKRGMTISKNMVAKRDKEGEPLPIQFHHEAPTGENASMYSSYCGVLGKTKVSLEYENWKRDVPQSLKDQLWAEMKKFFALTEDDKDRTIKKIGVLWRSWKTKLVKDLYSGKELECRRIYGINEGDTGFEKFKKRVFSDKFKELSEKNKELRKKNKYDHKLGKGGYERLRHAIVNHKIPTSVLTTTCEVTRHQYWLLARTDLNTGQIPKENVQQVAKKIAEINEEVVAGKWRPMRQDDVLTRALGNKEHYGRFRGVGSSTGVRKEFGGSQRPKRVKYTSEEDIHALENRVAQSVAQGFIRLFRGAGLPFPEDIDMSQLFAQKCPSSSIDSTPGPFQELHEAHDCFMAIEFGDILPEDELIVARGKVYPWNAKERVHGIPLREDHVRVSIEAIQAGKGECVLPTPTDELQIVAHVHGSSCQWPKHLVIVDLDEERFNEIARLFVPEHDASSRSNGQRVSFSGSHRARDTKIPPEQYKRLGTRCLELHKLLEGESEVNWMVSIEQELFEYEFIWDDEDVDPNNIPIDYKDIMDLFRLGWIGVAVIQVFERCMYDLLLDMGRGDRVGFACPEKLSTHRHGYLANVLSMQCRKSWIIMPIHHERHWFLLVIHRIAEEEGGTVYYLDSITKSLDQIHYKDTVDAFFGRMMKRRRIRKYPTWITVDCQQQPNSKDCGYYIMIYMSTIIRECVIGSHSIEEVFGDRNPHTDGSLDYIREFWASYFLDKCM